MIPCSGCPHPKDCKEQWDQCILGPAQGTHDGCGGNLRMGYGFAGGDGIGPYLWCDRCEQIADKWPDPEIG